jgi:hypothetical protein
MKNLVPELEKLKKVRDEAIKKATKDYDATLKQATAKLKAAFPQNSGGKATGTPEK